MWNSHSNDDEKLFPFRIAWTIDHAIDRIAISQCLVCVVGAAAAVAMQLTYANRGGSVAPKSAPLNRIVCTSMADRRFRDLLRWIVPPQPPQTFVMTANTDTQVIVMRPGWRQR